MKKILPILFCLFFVGNLSAQKKGNLTTKSLDEKKVKLKSIANGYLTPLPPEKAAEFEKEEAEEKARKEAAKNKNQKRSKKA